MFNQSDIGSCADRDGLYGSMDLHNNDGMLESYAGSDTSCCYVATLLWRSCLMGPISNEGHIEFSRRSGSLVDRNGCDTWPRDLTQCRCCSAHQGKLSQVIVTRPGVSLCMLCAVYARLPDDDVRVFISGDISRLRSSRIDQG